MDDFEQKGGGNENEELPYLFQMSGQKTFSKKLARETTYKVKFRDTWKDKKMRNLQNELRDMFDDILNRSRGNNNDLGRLS